MLERLGVARCCCGETPHNCDICRDHFGRADSTDISTGSACGWTEVSGNSSIAGNDLVFDASGLVTCDTVQAGAVPQYHVSAHMAGTTPGHAAGIVFDYVDSQNYKLAELTFSELNGVIRLRECVGGAFSTKAERTGLPMHIGTHPTIFCYVAGAATFTAYEDPTGAFPAGTVRYTWASGTNGTVGLAATMAGAGRVSFDNFAFQHHDARLTGCPDCEILNPCSLCCLPDKLPPSRLVVDVGAGGWVDALCGHCDQVQGEYIVEAVRECRWEYREWDVCTVTYPEARAECHDKSNGLLVFVESTVPPGHTQCHWRAVAQFTGGGGIEDPCYMPPSVEYRALLTNGDCATLPVTLTKFREVDLLPLCSAAGHMPDTITLEPA